MILAETNDSGNTVIYVALIGAAGTIIVALIGAIVGALFQKSKTNSDIRANDAKTEEQHFKNFQFGNEALDKAAGLLEKVGGELLVEKARSQTFKQEAERERLKAAEAVGYAKGAYEDRDKFFKMITDLQAEYKELKIKYESLAREFEDFKAQHIT